MINVGVIGTGFGQKIHLPGLQHHPQTEVVALWNHDQAKAEAVAQQHQVPHAFNQLDQLLRLPGLDAVAIATPPFLHAEMAKAALKAGKHILLEKPMALNVGEVQELERLARVQGLIAVADFEFRFVPAWQRCAELLREGVVGKPRLIKMDWLVVSRADPSRPWNWYARKDQGGGALGAIGSHAFDMIYWLFGEVRSLCGQLSCAIPQRPDPKANNALKPVDADDTALIWLELADGTPVQITLSSVTYQGRGHWLEVYGDEGTLILGSDNLKDYVHGFRLWTAPAGQTLTEQEIPKRLAFPQAFTDGRLAPFIRVVDHWVNCITTGQNAAPSLVEGVYSQCLMDLTHQSHQERRWLSVPVLNTLV